MERLTEVRVTARQLVVGIYLLPQDLCCNCGSREGLVAVDTRLPFSDLTGERAVPLTFPHCRICVPTGHRPPPRFGRTLAFFPAFFFLSAVGLGGVASLAPHAIPRTDNTMLAAILIMTTIGLVVPFALFRWRPPEHPAQTTRYQAVRLRVKKTFLGKVDAITFAFTNPVYAERFRAAYEKAASLIAPSRSPTGA
jgi:hypothetical protein